MEDETDDSLPTLNGDIETEIKEMMGLFDAPAFARRGHELEEMLRRVRRAAARPGPIASTWSGSGSGSGRAPRSARRTGPSSSPRRSNRSGRSARPSRRNGPLRRHRAIASSRSGRDLVAAVERFNRRWTAFVESINLGPANVVIDHYNRYYVLEKECVMGSGRLAARFFTPIASLSPSGSCWITRCFPYRASSIEAGSADQRSSRIAIQKGRLHDGTQPVVPDTPPRSRLAAAISWRSAPIAGLTSRSFAAEPPRDRQATGPAFEVTYTTAVSAAPVTGRVYVFLGSDRSSAEPRLGPDWFRPRPFFAVDVKGWKPGEPLRIDSKAAGFPDTLDGIPTRELRRAGRPPAQSRHAPHRQWRGERLWPGRTRQC